jgi:hypothetical protein
MKIRYKYVKGKKKPLCDYNGNCKNIAYKEVYPSFISKKKKGWSYLCRKHFLEEQKRLKNKLPYCSVD